MRVIIHSNAGFVGTGYGVQTDILSRALKQRGHDPIVSAFHGLRGVTFNVGGVPTLPGSEEQWGNDIILAHYDHYRPDVMFLLMDSWVVKTKILDAMPATIWTPVDHTPIPPQVADTLMHVKWPLAMSRHGERMMRAVGIDPLYAPHMVETDVYKPVDRDVARTIFGFQNAAFVAVTVAANKGFPPRKNIDRLVRAWAEFVKTHPKSILYIHTQPFATMGGLDIEELCLFYGLRVHTGSIEAGEDMTAYDVVLPDVYRLTMGNYTANIMNHLYNAGDVFVLPSAGEGFGVPAIEAQAAGCPVVLTDFTAFSELSEAGYAIPIDPLDDVTYTLQSSHQCLPKVSEIIKGLEWAYEHRQDSALRAKAREFAMLYDVKRVMDRYMLPALHIMAQGNADYMQFQHYLKRDAA